MPAGEHLTAADLAALDVTIRKAEQLCRAEFSVFVGRVQGDDARRFALGLHRMLVLPDRTILVMVDPDARQAEVVTGASVRSRLSDAQAEHALEPMVEILRGGDLVGGLTHGIQQLAEHARTQ